MNPQIVSNQVDMHNNKIQLSCNILCLILDMLYSSPCTHQYLKEDLKKGNTFLSTFTSITINEC